MAFPTPEWDLALFKLINMQWRNDVFDFLMPIFSDRMLVWLIAIPLVLITGIKTKKWRHLLIGLAIIGAAVGANDIGTNIIKDSVGRVRPKDAIAQSYHYSYKKAEWLQRPANFVQTDDHGSSFISGHASNSAAAVVMAMLLWPKLRSFLWILPLLIGYSRVYLAKHYPLDVLSGWAFGICISLILWKVLLHRFYPAWDEPEKQISEQQS